MTRSKLLGTGMAIPRYCLTNAELEKLVDTSDEWIRSRTGIEKRYIAKDGETCVSLAHEAAKQALRNSNVSANQIDLIVFATLTPDRMMPSAACELGALLDIPTIPGFDLTAACSGFVFALSVADQFIRTGMYKNILCIGAEQLSAYVNWKDRSTCVLFGDGAGAAVLSATHDRDESHILSTHMFSESSQGGLLCIPASGSAITPRNPKYVEELATITMAGRELFKYAVSGMIKAARVALEANHLTVDQVKLLIPHQANLRIIESVCKRLDFPMERTMLNVHKYGNTSAATIPIALHEAITEKRVRRGDLILLDSFGGGLTYGSCLLRY